MVADVASAVDVYAEQGAVFQEERFDFGKSVRGALIEHDFTLTNNGSAPLAIEKVTMTPPLLATRIPGEIAPGATGSIHTRLDTSELQGTFTGDLVVYVKGHDAPLATLAFEGLVVAPIEIAPLPAMFIVGERGRGAERSIEIINHEPQPFHIVAVPHSSDAFTTALETTEYGQRYRLTLTLRPDGPVGKRTDVITLPTSSVRTPTLRIPVHTYLRERVYAFPDAVDLGAFKRSTVDSHPEVLASLTQTLMVYQTNGSRFEIAVDSDIPTLKLTCERGPQNDRYEITVGLAPELPVGLMQGSIRIRTNDPQVPLLVVPVNGVILEG